MAALGGSYSISNREDNRDTVNLLITALQQGHLNCTYTATLTPNATSTVVPAATCSSSSGIIPCPLTADAANDEGLMWFTPAPGQFTVNHASNARVDRTFVFIVIG